MDQPILTVRNLTKSYGDKQVLSGLSFEVGTGEIFGFIGCNGTGKSTTIKCITNIINFDGGEIAIGGHDIVSDPIEAKKLFGLVLDDCNAYEEMSGKEYVTFIASVYGVSQREFDERYQDLTVRFAIAEDMDRLIKFYSHGMKQKVSMIASLIHEPALWILDEPLTGLDIITVRTLVDYMLDYKKRGHSVFLTSHNIDIVERICDRVVFIDRGNILNTYDLTQDRQAGFSLEDEFFSLVAGRDGK